MSKPKSGQEPEAENRPPLYFEGATLVPNLLDFCLRLQNVVVSERERLLQDMVHIEWIPPTGVVAPRPAAAASAIYMVLTPPGTNFLSANQRFRCSLSLVSLAAPGDEWTEVTYWGQEPNLLLLEALIQCYHAWFEKETGLVADHFAVPVYLNKRVG